MICNKATFIKKKNDFLSFRWWIELNEEIGYEKISHDRGPSGLFMTFSTRTMI
jgi:hypothetical protein